ncbi:amino acid ABC transporter permease [Lacticaseibacillus baoqingensis]|uniref:Amino acid ABC transporter permease n=1 Tax=Lacticaseibacillus baoqingensis TaxID=2486013 RepID=A0ABW4E5X8_9LACO|nr:amino acid ABC transporter permease [Lacticaseibacillus baoqingensis]
MNLHYTLSIIPQIVAYLPVTLAMAVVAMGLAIVFGALLTIVYNSRRMKWFAQFYLLIFRGFPTLVLLFIAYYGIPQMLHVNDTTPAWITATLCLAFKEAAYLEEIFRSGIVSVDPGQIEAGRSLGLSRSLVYRQIVIPQALRAIVPPTGSTFIALLKETSLAFSIGVTELFGAGKMIASENFKYFDVYLVVGILYVIVIYFYTLLQSAFEKRLNRIYENAEG